MNQPLTELTFDSFECQAPQISVSEVQDDWTQYIDPELLALEDTGDAGKEEHDLSKPSSLPPAWTCIDPSFLHPDDDRLSDESEV